MDAEAHRKKVDAARDPMEEQLGCKLIPVKCPEAMKDCNPGDKAIKEACEKRARDS